MAFWLRLWGRKSTPGLQRWLRRMDSILAVAPASRLGVMTALLVGDARILRHRLTVALEKAPRGARAKYLADVSLAGELPALGQTFATRMDPAADGGGTTWAKIHWYNGRVSEAINCLREDDARTRRLRERYLAEQDVYGRWTPVVEAVPDYEPRERVVLHLLNNSLPYTQTGYTKRSHSLLSAQHELGWDVHAATRLGYPETLGILGPSRKHDIDGVRYHRLLSRNGIPNLRDRLQEEAEQLLALVLDVRPSVLHTTTHFVNGLVVRAVAEATGLPWIYEVRGQLADTWVSKRSPEAATSERYLDFTRRETDVMLSADLVFTLGHAMRQRIIGFGVDPARVLLSPNAVGDAYLDMPPPPRVARSEMGLDPEPLLVGTVSSLIGYEGIDDLVEAYAILRRERDDVRLKVVGDGPALSELRLQAAALGLDPHEVFPGRVSAERAVRYHRAMDVFVVPRKDFAVTRSVTPLKPVEAMATCRPVVASDLPALREMVVPGVTGLCVPASDPAALARAIETLLDDGSQRAAMGRAGRSVVLETRTWQRVAELSIARYGQLRAEVVDQ
ncbi:glycosyltransferase family 4 protein [Zafaria sp. Z1313]|uniref:glycosyltransferase family 4 protein n=1 Tax=unclassified Zafaria TaxID=2828765 RepID=UPI002E78A50C|nr:glycosyltransferase family 4 protein [Zafaria sp. J156]MEE1620744.1 glycosyltransferase family 4 protein [Zafaria sp. J156]